MPSSEHPAPTPRKRFVKGALLEYASYLLAAFSVVIGTIAVFSRSIPEHHDKALLWFLFALIAIMIPYVREITFKDLKVVIDKIDKASKTLEGAAITSKELANRLNRTRDELIDGYQELLKRLGPEERKQRVLALSRLYLDEMGVQPSTVKRWLVELGMPIGTVDDTLDDEYLDALRRLQSEHGLGDDGIFGYRTLDLITKLREKNGDGAA